jgi:uncharacterized protein
MLWKKEMHTFAEHGQSVAFDVVDLNTWLMSSVERDVLLAIDGRVSENAIVERLCKCYPAGEVQAALETWRARGVLLDREPQPVFIKEDCPDVPTFMTLNLAQVCNLRCRYCFADAGTYDQTAMMNREVARASVDMLMRYSGEEEHCNILFFGGEPLLNMDTLSHIIEYAREQAKVYGKSVHFSLITNGTLLTPQNVDYLVHQRVRVEISIDGPAKFHDRCRVFGDGRGSHAQVAAGARMLCEKSRWPVAANATLTHCHPSFKEMAAHFESLGFGGSGIKLCVLPEEMQGVLSDIALTTRDIVELQEECREYVYDLVAQAEFKPAFPNLFEFRQFVRFLASRRRRTCNCGVGRYLISVSATGDVYPCYGVIGVKGSAYRMGNVLNGPLHFELLKDICRTTNVEQRSGCQDCWGRYLCAGGANCFAHDVQDTIAAESVRGSCTLAQRVMELAIYATAVWREREPQLDQKLRRYSVDFYLSKAAVSAVPEQEGALNDWPSH